MKVLKNKSFLFITSSQFIHKIGECLYDLLMPLLILHITGSPILMGLMYIVGEAAEFLVYLFGGAIVDSINRKKLLIVIAILQATFISLLPIAEGVGQLNIILLFIVAFIIDICVSLYGIADISIIPQIVDKKELPEANGIMQVSLSTAQAIGPAVSGLIIAALGLFTSVWVNTFVFILLLTTFTLIKSYKDDTPDEKITPKLILNNSIEGLKFTLKDKFLALLIFWQAFFIFGIHGSILMLTFHISEYLSLGSQHLGVVMTFGAVGGIIGGFLFPYLHRSVKPGLLLLLSATLVATSFALLALTTHILAIGVVYAFTLLGISMVSRLIALYIQSNTESIYMGRVMAATRLFTSILAPLSIFIASWVSESFGTPALFIASSITILLTVILAFPSRLKKHDWNIENDAGKVASSQ
ncbi:MFS transporter [Bacillus thermotolerans]|uniref:MFS transporter n=1 Tax=Bacillus thermotolerans TaxID=1221996 RepID=UPI000582CB5A|nr:MFS transporter [Bacillus thermotolerans]KKB34125.1 permease [Bacillus thermotolerans]